MHSRILENLCKKHHIENYHINNDMSISIDGDVHLDYMTSDGKIPIKFKEVSGSFFCNNSSLTSLKNCPRSVGGRFNCNDNNLTSLKYCPEYANSDFSCSGNLLTSLEYCPKNIGGGFFCSRNNLTSLEYCPKNIGFDFYCNDNEISSLEHIPEIITYLSCYGNKITNFDGLPEFFERTINLVDNPLYEIYKLFNQDPRCIYWIREFGVIQGDEVVRDRLEEVYHTLGISIPKNIELNIYLHDNFRSTQSMYEISYQKLYYQ